MTRRLPLPACRPRRTNGQGRLALTHVRRSMQAKVHIARKDLALDEDTYRDTLERITTHRSLAACSETQIEALLSELRRLGWKGAKPASSKPNVRMIHAIWRDLKPFLSDASDAALRAFVRRQTKSKLHPEGVDAAEFLDGSQANRVIEGLKAWLARERAAAAGGRS